MTDNQEQILRRGLISSPKYLPTWYNYDEIGSDLNHQCTTKNPDYYLTSSETSLLRDKVQDIIPRLPENLALVDLGSGNCIKSRYAINEMLKRQKTVKFYPIDISEDFLLRSAKELSKEYDDSLLVTPIPADYVEGIKQLKENDGAKVILWFGSMINLSYEVQVNILKLMSTIMTGECRLVLSADITQDRDTILKAYDDDGGLMRSFIQNGIIRLNKDAGSQIDMSKFTWEVDFIASKDPQSMSYVRKYMMAKEDVQFKMPQLDIVLKMEKGERLYFHEGEGFSCKYTLEQLRNIVEKAGLRLQKHWIDEHNHVAICLCALS